MLVGSDAHLSAIITDFKLGAMMCVLCLAFLTVVRDHSRYAYIAGALIGGIGALFLFVFSQRWDASAQLFTAIFFMLMSLTSIRSLFRSGSRKIAFESNRKILRRLFGERVSTQIFAPIGRMMQRENLADELGTSVVEILKREKRGD